MGWLWGGRRGVSWRDQTVDSITAPPLPLMVLFGLVAFFMCLSTYLDFKAQVARTKSSLRMFVFLVPLLVVLLVYIRLVSYRFFYPYGRPVYRSGGGGDGGIAPWGLAVLVVLLLVMVHYQVSIQSSWFPLM
nr:uncharacterized protein LOC109152740 [Ipomoea batatas]GMD99271.1 uncharacterized protein LOC109152740 [Ipomoea batatas]